MSTEGGDDLIFELLQRPDRILIRRFGFQFVPPLLINPKLTCN
jgi:hypothetical protein